jgi:uncharacterized membrane protein YkoI
MNRSTRIVAGIFAALVIAAGAQAAGKKIEKSDLPDEVRKTADRESGGATVTGYSQDTDEYGDTVYGVDLVVDGHARSIVIGEDGVVVEVDEEVPWDRLPADVQTGLKAQAGAGKVGKVQSVTREGKVVAYEAEVDTDGAPSEVRVGPTGAPPADEPGPPGPEK